MLTEVKSNRMTLTLVLLESLTYPRQDTGFDISTSPLSPASEFLKKGLPGKYILVFTCTNGQADFLSTTHFFMRKNGTNTQIYANNAMKLKKIGFTIIKSMRNNM